MPFPFRRSLFPLAALVATGCVQHTLRAVTPVTQRLVSREPFIVHVPATADSSGNRCAHLRVEGRVSAVRGDTMFFESVRSEQRPAGVVDCLQGREGFIVISSAPALRSERIQFYPMRTVFFVLIAGSVAVLGTLILILSGG